MSCISDWKNRNCFEWTVERPPVTRPRFSPRFTVNGFEYYLQFSCDNRENYSLDRVLTIYGAQYDYHATLHISVLVENSTGYALPHFRLTATTYSSSRTSIWMYSKSDILKSIPNFLTDGVLKFLVTFPGIKASFTFEIKPPKAADQMVERALQTPAYLNAVSCPGGFSGDLSKLLEDHDLQADQKPDVDLACGDLVLKAHKLILSTRSTVFAAALRSDMAESRTGRIDVRDMKPGTFREFVLYMYSGSLPDLTLETARQLYEAADRYAVRDLMKLCSSFLEDNLEPANACEILALADAHSDWDLKESVVTYIVDHEIPQKDDQWLVFCETHPKLGSEVLKRCFASQRNKQMILSTT